MIDFLPRAVELEANTNPMAMVVLAHLRALETRQHPDDRRIWKFRLVRNLYERGMVVTEVRQLFRLIDWLMMLPTDLEIKFRQDLDHLEEEKYMPFVTSIEKLALLDVLDLQLQQKFGADGASLLPEISKIDDGNQLKKLLAAIIKVESLDQFRQLLQKTSPP